MRHRITVPSANAHPVPVDVYLAATPAPRPAVVLLPGGGYDHLSTREAEPVALRFLSLGYNVFTVSYRVAPCRYPAPQLDAASVIAHVRAHAQELATDPRKIVLLGFSAGGHLAGWLGATWHEAAPWAAWGLAPQAIRPNALVLGYPVVTAGPFAHRSSFVSLTGTDDPAMHAAYGLEDHVTAQYPPTFIWSTFDDASVPCENALLLASALSRAHVPAELHVFRHGPHGAALYCEASSGPEHPEMNVPEAACWPEMADAFLKHVWE